MERSMPDDQEFNQIPVKITHVAEPKRYPVEQIAGCYPINLTDRIVRDPLSEEEKYLPGHSLYEKMLATGWVASMIGWARDDGPPNYGHAPTVNHSLIVVMVKLKAN